jgi:hypothetical protein
VSVKDVLEVLAQFDRFGGASLELTARELSDELSVVAAVWSRAITEGFLERAGTERGSGEEVWRLSERGRHANETLDEIL